MPEHTLGTAYVQIVPSAQGISGSISNVLGKEANSAGTSAGSTIASKIKGVLATAAIGETLRQSILQGAALEQSLGGIETLFKEHADIVIKNASNAYKTVGMSANKYMENATSFAASLLQSVNGNTEEAARLTDMALIDMADNANKMGTNMENITNAYQGFAKQNYTMLDNLKLGYGGTKTEMERLLADASKLSGVKYDISNLSDVYSAIHVIQEELDITGTTAKEASETLAGSFSAMKAAAEDFMGNITLGREIGPSMIALAETTGTFLFDNLLPAIGNIITSLPTAIYELIKTGIPKFMDSGLVLIENVATGILNGIPHISEALVTTVSEGIEALKTKLPIMLEAGTDFIENFVSGLISSIPDIIRTIGIIYNNIIEYLKENLPLIMAYGGELIGNLARGIIENLPEILAALFELQVNLFNSIMEMLPILWDVGVDLISNLAKGIVAGITNALSTATNKIKITLIKPIDDARKSIKSIIDKIKSFFNITLSFKGIKLPHIDLSWKTDGIIAQAAKLLGVPGVPKFTVNWYKSGGIFDNPSIIGVGEAGTEAVVPLEKLWSKLDGFIGDRISDINSSLSEEKIKSIVAESISALADELINAMSGVTIEHTTTLDGRAVAKGLAPLMDSSLGRRAALAERGI